MKAANKVSTRQGSWSSVKLFIPSTSSLEVGTLFILIVVFGETFAFTACERVCRAPTHIVASSEEDLFFERCSNKRQMLAVRLSACRLRHFFNRIQSTALTTGWNCMFHEGGATIAGWVKQKFYVSLGVSLILGRETSVTLRSKRDYTVTLKEPERR